MPRQPQQKFLTEASSEFYQVIEIVNEKKIVPKLRAIRRAYILHQKKFGSKEMRWYRGKYIAELVPKENEILKIQIVKQ